MTNLDLCINSPNLNSIVKRSKGEWLAEKQGQLQRIAGFWAKAFFVIYNIFTFCALLRRTSGLVDETCRDLIFSGVNCPHLKLDLNDACYRRYQGRIKQIRNALKRMSPSLYSEETLQNIKEFASCPALIEAREAMKRGIHPQLIDEGINGSYIIYGRDRQPLGIFKARDQEAGTQDNPKHFDTRLGEQIIKQFGISPGTSYLRERVAYLLDKKERFSSVPMTRITHFSRQYFPKIHKPEKVTGSFQIWKRGCHHAYDDYQILPSFLSSGQGNKIPDLEIHKIAIFDIRMLNCDRHLKNFLVDASWNTHPIDHGFTLPGSAHAIRFDWINFAQAKKPFSAATLAYIERLDPLADVALIRRKVPRISQRSLDIFVIATKLLQVSAKKGLTAYQIADLMMGRRYDGLLKFINHFMPIHDPSRTSNFEKTICSNLLCHPYLNQRVFLEQVVDAYLQKR